MTSVLSAVIRIYTRGTPAVSDKTELAEEIRDLCQCQLLKASRWQSCRETWLKNKDHVILVWTGVQPKLDAVPLTTTKLHSLKAHNNVRSLKFKYSIFSSIIDNTETKMHWRFFKTGTLQSESRECNCMRQNTINFRYLWKVEISFTFGINIPSPS